MCLVSVKCFDRGQRGRSVTVPFLVGSTLLLLQEVIFFGSKYYSFTFLT